MSINFSEILSSFSEVFYGRELYAKEDEDFITIYVSPEPSLELVFDKRLKATVTEVQEYKETSLEKFKSDCWLALERVNPKLNSEDLVDFIYLPKGNTYVFSLRLNS